MKTKSLSAQKARALQIIESLSRAIPARKIALHFNNPWQLAVATILSAQCTDERVNQVTPALFRKYKTVSHYAKANLKQFERDIYSTGFYRAKAKNIQACARALLERFNGRVPQKMEELVSLPGIGRKTANVILGNAFGVPGIAVDTHVKRVTCRLGLTRHTDPVKIEYDLNQIIPQSQWTQFSHLIIWHGRLTCRARRPRCSECAVRTWCPSREK